MPKKYIILTILFICIICSAIGLGGSYFVITHYFQPAPPLDIVTKDLFVPDSVPDYSNVAEIKITKGNGTVSPEYQYGTQIIIKTSVAEEYSQDSYQPFKLVNTTNISTEQFKQITAALTRRVIGPLNPPAFRSECIGGSSQYLEIKDKNGNPIVKGTIATHCGTPYSGNVGGDFAGFIQDLQNIVPGINF